MYVTEKRKRRVNVLSESDMLWKKPKSSRNLIGEVDDRVEKQWKKHMIYFWYTPNS